MYGLSWTMSNTSITEKMLALKEGVPKFAANACVCWGERGNSASGDADRMHGVESGSRAIGKSGASTVPSRVGTRAIAQRRRRLEQNRKLRFANKSTLS
jgi:hypothetical protein